MYRYVRYVGPKGSYSRIGEFGVYSEPPLPAPAMPGPVSVVSSDASQGVLELGARRRVETWQATVETGELGLHDVGGHRAQGHDGGRHGRDPAGVEERTDLLGDDAAHADHVDDAGVLVAELLRELAQADQAHAWQVRSHNASAYGINGDTLVSSHPSAEQAHAAATEV